MFVRTALTSTAAWKLEYERARAEAAKFKKMAAIEWQEKIRLSKKRDHLGSLQAWIRHGELKDMERKSLGYASEVRNRF